MDKYQGIMTKAIKASEKLSEIISKNIKNKNQDFGGEDGKQ